MAKLTQKCTSRSNAGAGGRITKKDQLIKLLRQKNGTDIKAINDKLGWQHHSTRAALSGLRKAGYELETQKLEGKTARYTILSIPALAEVQPDAA